MPTWEEVANWLVENIWQEPIAQRVNALESWLPSTLSTVFLTIFLLGFIFLAVAFLLGEVLDGAEDVFHNVLDMFHIDIDTDIDHDTSGGPSVFSPRVISVFVTVFGGTGYITSISDYGPFVSSGAGLVGGVLTAAVFWGFFNWMYKQEATSSISTRGLVGRVGTVRTAIPKGALGEVVVDYIGSRVVRPARSADGKTIPENRTVMVEAVMGRTLIVRPKTS